MEILFAVILAAVLIWAAYRWLGPGRGAGSEFKCRTCRHCRKLFEDGVMCAYRDSQVFKNPAQIDMCPDHKPR